MGDDVIGRALALVQQYGTVGTAARKSGIAKSTLEGQIRTALGRGAVTEQQLIEWRSRGGRVEAVAPVQAAPAVLVAPPAVDQAVLETPAVNYYDAEWKVFAREIGMLKDRYEGPCRRVARIGRLKILIVPDLHVPFHDRAAFAAMLKREHDADLVVFMGDLGDSYAFSTFIKYESVPFEQELAGMTLVLDEVSARFPDVLVIEGNHDAPRLEKRLRERLSSDMISAILSMTGGTLSPIEALCKRRYQNVRLASHQVDRHQVKWMAQVGDAVFCHAEKFSRVPGSTLRSIEEWFSDNERILNLQPWRVLVQAHTHQLALFPWKADKFLIECGCMATTPGYALSPRLGGRPQRLGYVTLEQVDGVTDLNSVRMFWLDSDETLRQAS